MATGSNVEVKKLAQLNIQNLCNDRATAYPIMESIHL